MKFRISNLLLLFLAAAIALGWWIDRRIYTNWNASREDSISVLAKAVPTKRLIADLQLDPSSDRVFKVAFRAICRILVYRKTLEEIDRLEPELAEDRLREEEAVRDLLDILHVKTLEEFQTRAHRAFDGPKDRYYENAYGCYYGDPAKLDDLIMDALNYQHREYRWNGIPQDLLQ